MRVEPGDGDTWLRDAEFVFQVGMQNADHFVEQSGRDGIGHFAQGQVGRRQRHAQTAADEHHHDSLCAAMLGQIFGVAGKRKTGIVDDALVHRRGDDGVIRAVQAAGEGDVEQGQYVGAVTGVEFARRDGSGDRNVVHMQRTRLMRGNDVAGDEVDVNAELRGAGAQHFDIAQYREAA